MYQLARSVRGHTRRQATHPGRASTMFSSTLKRSAATLGMVAGLLAAAAPASAAVGIRENGSQGAVKAPANADPQMKDKAVVVLIGANDYGWTEGNDNACCRDD